MSSQVIPVILTKVDISFYLEIISCNNVGFLLDNIILVSQGFSLHLSRVSTYCLSMVLQETLLLETEDQY